MHCEVLTLFPEVISGVASQSILKRAQEMGHLSLGIHNIRDYTSDPHRVADDVPYGGGGGMVMKAEPIFEAIDDLRRAGGNFRFVLPSPQGTPFTQLMAEELSREPRTLVFICGHYEGIDERVRSGLAAEEISIGDFILNGGEVAAMVLIDSLVRMVPGVLGDERSNQDDSFSSGNRMLEGAQYTRPREYRGHGVPEVLLSGDHERIAKWREQQRLEQTKKRRADLLDDESSGSSDNK